MLLISGSTNYRWEAINTSPTTQNKTEVKIDVDLNLRFVLSRCLIKIYRICEGGFYKCPPVKNGILLPMWHKQSKTEEDGDSACYQQELAKADMLVEVDVYGCLQHQCT